MPPHFIDGEPHRHHPVPDRPKRDLLVVNKTDLAPMVGADLDVMRRDAAAARGDRPTVLISLAHDPSAGPVQSWVRDQFRVAQAV